MIWRIIFIAGRWSVYWILSWLATSFNWLFKLQEKTKINYCRTIRRINYQLFLLHFARNAEKASTPMKKFYFGMEAETEPEATVNGGDVNEVVDKFAETLRKSTPVLSNTSPSESFSSEPTNDDVSLILFIFLSLYSKIFNPLTLSLE